MTSITKSVAAWIASQQNFFDAKANVEIARLEMNKAIRAFQDANPGVDWTKVIWPKSE